METRANYILVGGFILVLVAGLFVFILWVVKPASEAANVTYLIYFDETVSGLNAGSTVRYRGVPVGTVADIRIDPDNFQRIRVTVSLKRDTPIKTDAIAYLRLEGVTGQRSIEIEGGSAEAPLLAALPGQKYPVIPSKPSSLETLLGGAPQLLEEATLAAKEVADLLNEENRAAIAATLKNLATVSGAIAARSEEIGQTLTNVSAMAEKMRDAADELSTTMTVARMAFATVDEQAAAVGGDVHALIADLRTTSHSLAETSDELGAMIAENREPVKGFTGEGLYQVSLLTEELRGLARKLSRIADTFESNPRGFLFGTPSKELEAR